MRFDKKKNAGFTFVELLVAVTILAIIVVPLMHAIVSSAKTNAKSRQVAAATVLAQNEMEKLQTEPFLSIQARSTEVEETDPATGKVYYKEVYTRGCPEDTETLDVGGVDYDMVVELSEDAKTSKEDIATDPDAADDEVTDYNENELAQIYDMNEVTDAFYIQDDEMDEKMAGKFPGNKAENLLKMTREIVVDITETGTAEAGKKEVEAELEILYSLDGVTKSAFSRKQSIFDSTDNALRNIYLFYQPLSYSGLVRESIVIRNNSSIETNVYLICQEGRRPAPYKIDVNVLEPGRAASDMVKDDTDLIHSPIVAKTRVRANLRYEAGNPAASEVQLGYSNDGLSYEEKILLTGTTREVQTSELTDYKDLSAEKTETRVYKVVVKVYEDGVDKDAEEALATITGTKKE